MSCLPKEFGFEHFDGKCATEAAVESSWMAHKRNINIFEEPGIDDIYFTSAVFFSLIVSRMSNDVQPECQRV